MGSIFTSHFSGILITSLLIFCLRILDVSIGTARIIFVTKGHRVLAPLFGFFEVLIWLIAISRVMKTMTEPIYFVVYAAGFAAGNVVGMWLERRLAVGVSQVRVISDKGAEAIIKELRGKGFGVTSMEGKGKDGPVTIVLTIVKNRHLGSVIEILNKHDPNAFYTIEEVYSVSKGIRHTKTAKRGKN